MCRDAIIAFPVNQRNDTPMTWTQLTRTHATTLSRRAALGSAAALGAGLFATQPGLALTQPTPAVAGHPGLETWSGQLGTLDPAAIVDLLLAKPVAPFMGMWELEVRETSYVTDAGFPHPNKIVGEVSIGTTAQPGGEFEIGTGTMVIMNDADAAAAAIATIEPGQSERQSIWAFPYAGLDARWIVSASGTSSMAVQAGPVLVIGSDMFLTDGAYSHLMDSIQNVLQNTAHIVYHLFAATDQELGID